jgi:hypothetical protein
MQEARAHVARGADKDVVGAAPTRKGALPA